MVVVCLLSVCRRYCLSVFLTGIFKKKKKNPRARVELPALDWNGLGTMWCEKDVDSVAACARLGTAEFSRPNSDVLVAFGHGLGTAPNVLGLDWNELVFALKPNPCPKTTRAS